MAFGGLRPPRSPGSGDRAEPWGQSLGEGKAGHNSSASASECQVLAGNKGMEWDWDVGAFSGPH